MRARRVGQPDETKAPHLDQAGNLRGCRSDTIDDLHPIVRDERETVVEKPQEEVRLAATRRP